MMKNILLDLLESLKTAGKLLVVLVSLPFLVLFGRWTTVGQIVRGLWKWVKSQVEVTKAQINYWSIRWKQWRRRRKGG